MMKRKKISASEKLAVLKRYLVEKKPISKLCEEFGLQPSQIYYWQTQLFEQGASVFERKNGKSDPNLQKIAKLEERVAQHEEKLTHKNEIIAELLEENVRAKKSIGEL